MLRGVWRHEQKSQNGWYAPGHKNPMTKIHTARPISTTIPAK